MSSLLKSTSIAAGFVIAAYGIGLFVGPSIRTQIEIAAPASQVWKGLVNGKAYPEWNPFIKHLSGDLVVGDQLKVSIQPEGKTPMNFTPNVLIADESKELRWVGRLGFKGVFDGEHYFKLEETSKGTTVLRHGESFKGILAYPLFALIGKDTKNGFNAMNEALKKRVERGV